MKFPKKLIQETIGELAGAIFEGDQNGEFENLRLGDAHHLLFLLECLIDHDPTAIEMYSDTCPTLLEYLPENITKYCQFWLGNIIQECIKEELDAKIKAQLAKNAENNAKSAEG